MKILVNVTFVEINQIQDCDIAITSLFPTTRVIAFTLGLKLSKK